MTSEDDFNDQVTSKSIYFYDTLVTDSNVKITTNGFTLYSTSESCGSPRAGVPLVYEIKTTSAISSGATRTYGSSSSPAVTIYVTGAGFTADGTVFDVEYKFTSIEIYNFRSAAEQVCVFEFDKQ